MAPARRSGMQPLYEQIADRYLAAVANGTLPPGSRMPSVRELMRLHGISLSTALQACRLMERRGVLEARPRAGYFVRRPTPLPGRTVPLGEPLVTLPDPAQFVGINERISAIVDGLQRHPVRLNLAGAVANPVLYPAQELKAAATRALRRDPALYCRAAPAHGLPALQAQLARRSLTLGVDLAPRQILITYGSTESLNLALRAVAGPGDIVAVESPAYYGLLQILEGLGMRALEIPTSPQTGLSVEALALAVDSYDHIKAVVVVPDLQNPLGCLMPDEHKQRLLRLCESRGIALIEDDVCAPLVDAPTQPRPIRSWDRNGTVIYCASLRKVLGPGLRVGWMHGGRWHARIEMLKYSQSRTTDVVSQAVLADLLASGGVDRQIRRLKAALSSRRERARDLIGRLFPEGTRLNAPCGGFTLWAQLPSGPSGPPSSTDVYARALAEGLHVSPGALFSNAQRFEHHLRINVAAPAEDELEPALAALAGVIDRLTQDAAIVAGDRPLIFHPVQ